MTPTTRAGTASLSLVSAPCDHALLRRSVRSADAKALLQRRTVKSQTSGDRPAAPAARGGDHSRGGTMTIRPASSRRSSSRLLGSPRPADQGRLAVIQLTRGSSKTSTAKPPPSRRRDADSTGHVGNATIPTRQERRAGHQHTSLPSATSAAPASRGCRHAAPQVPGHFGASRVDAGHQLLSGEKLGEADGAFHDAGLGRDRPLRQFTAHLGHTASMRAASHASEATSATPAGAVRPVRPDRRRASPATTRRGRRARPLSGLANRTSAATPLRPAALEPRSPASPPRDLALVRNLNRARRVTTASP